VWEELGIGPTRDRHAIRVAYARRLKAIGADRSPAEFIRLRAAFEACMRWAQDGQIAPDASEADDTGGEANEDGDGGGDSRDGGPDERVTPQPRQAKTFDQGSAEDFRVSAVAAASFSEAWREARGAGRFEPLAALFIEGLARALIPVGAEHARLAEVVEVALADATASSVAVRRFAEAHGLISGQASLAGQPLGRSLVDRLAAETWLCRVRTASTRGFPLLRPRDARVARLLLGKRPPWRLQSKDVSTLLRELQLYRHFAPYLGPDVSAARADRLDRRIAFLTARGLAMRLWRRLRWLIFVVVGVETATLALGLIVSFLLVVVRLVQPR